MGELRRFLRKVGGRIVPVDTWRHRGFDRGPSTVTTFIFTTRNLRNPVMTTIDHELVIETLWLILHAELKPALASAKVFDRIAHHLRRSPRFRGMSIVELDAALYDAKREFEYDVDELEWKLVRAFRNAIGFDDDEAAA
jgi:hypothetical protein